MVDAMAELEADAIVVAAGTSSRMGVLDKLAADLGGRPLLSWSITAIAGAPSVRRIVVVRPPGALEVPGGRVSDKVTAVVAGGARRAESVAAGIRALDDGDAAGSDERVLLVHDGARPLVSTALVNAVAEAAALHGAAIPVLPIPDTIKRLAGEMVAGTIDRTGVATAQTPQGIRRDVLRAALRAVPPDAAARLTDEAALLEAAGIPVHVVPGEWRNLKITTPDDLERARALAGAADTRRTGIGEDGHPFGPGQPLRLGGLDIAGAPRLHGHSDGDAALHAIANALLGAAGLGDLGGLAPADGRTPAGIDSGELLERVLARVATAGWRPRSIDLTIGAARPRLGPHLGAMRAAIASRLRLPVDAVSVKAATGNLSGDVGAGRLISARAIATISPEE